VLLVTLALALGLVFGASGSHLPATQPGLGRDEGVFLVTTNDAGASVTYFIAQDQRHSVSADDVQAERQMNPLWPVRNVDRDEVLGFAEGAPVGSAPAGLLAVPVAPAAPIALDAPAGPITVDAPAAPIVVDAPTADDLTYLVQRGDSAFLIARKFGVDQTALLAANGIANANRVEAGQTLVIPSDAIAPTTLQAAEAPVAGDDPNAYTVQPGDSAFLIARKFGIDQQALLEANGIENANRVYVGQTLQIPGGDL
jgi:LysM repeat protein